MVSVAITNGDSVVFTFADGEVKTVRSEITSQVDSIPMPASAPANTILLDLGGVIKKITVTGTLFVTATTRTSVGTVTSLLAQKQWLEDLMDGGQTSMLFTSNFESYSHDGTGSWESTSTTQVVVQKLTFAENEGNPNEIPFVMNLMVGT